MAGAGVLVALAAAVRQLEALERRAGLRALPATRARQWRPAPSGRHFHSSAPLPGRIGSSWLSSAQWQALDFVSHGKAVPGPAGHGSRL